MSHFAYSQNSDIAEYSIKIFNSEMHYEFANLKISDLNCNIVTHLRVEFKDGVCDFKTKLNNGVFLIKYNSKIKDENFMYNKNECFRNSDSEFKSNIIQLTVENGFVNISYQN